MSSDSHKKKLKVSCPHCKKKFNYYDSEFRPFCSERCKMVDLGHWLEESYAVPSLEEDIPEDEESAYEDGQERH